MNVAWIVCPPGAEWTQPTNQNGESMSSGVIEVPHGTYRIRTMKIGTSWRASSFVADHLVFKDTSGPTSEAAIEAMKARLDERDQKQRQGWVDGVPSVDSFVEALQKMEIAEPLKAMLRAHANADDRRMTSIELAKAGGYKAYTVTATHYGKLGRQVGDYLGMPMPAEDEGTGHAAVLAVAEPASKKADIVWQMHPTLAEALQKLDLA